MSMSDKELQDAYKQSQQRHAINSDMKQRILQHNALHKTQSDWGISIEKFIALFDSSAFKFSAVAFALIIMFGVYNVGKWANTAHGYARHRRFGGKYCQLPRL